MIPKPLILSLILLPAALPAQVFTPTQSTPQSTAPKSSNSSSQSDSGNRNSGSNRPAFGEEIPILNPGSETITIGGLTIPLGDNRVIKARFEKYLNQPPEDIQAAIDYHQTIDQVIDLLAPRAGDPNSRQTKIEDAFALLPVAAAYPGDANMCQTLAETIYASLQAKKDIRSMGRINEKLEAERHVLAQRADFMLRNASDSGIGGTSPASKKEGRTAKAQALRATSQEHIAMLRQIAELEASRKKHTIQSEKQILSTKIQFQATIMQWLLQRRFHHVIMACRFYNVLWQDGDNALRIQKDSTMAKMFSQSLGFSPTVTALDSVANEAVRDTQNALDACVYLQDQGDLHTASQRLLEAFAVGEFLSPLATLERDRKRRLQIYIRELSLLFDAIQARDYGRARELTVKLKQDAKDFPSSKAESAISAHVIASNMAISKAKKALLAEDEDAVALAIGKATEYWPTNPKLAEFTQLLEQGTEVNVMRNDFDRLLREKNYREIYKRQYEFAPVVAANAESLDAFNQIIRNLHTIEGALGKAEEFVKIGNAYAAWEQLETLREEFPDDPVLGRELEKLAPKVADLAKALDDARILEERTPAQTASAINNYLKAKSIYPSSQFAQDGLTRLIDETIGTD